MRPATILVFLLIAPGALGNGQSQMGVRTPPPTILSKAWEMLAVEGPISNDFTSVSIIWRDGAYYMIVKSNPRRRWKIMLVPPLGERDWDVKLLVSKGRRIATKDAKLEKSSLENPSADLRVAWSRMFAKAVPSLPALYAEAADFKVRAVPEEKRVVFFFETTSSIVAWITFTVDPSGKFVFLDRGF